MACGSGAHKLTEEIGCQTPEDKPLLALAAAQIVFAAPSKTSGAHPLYLREADVTI